MIEAIKAVVTKVGERLRKHNKLMCEVAGQVVECCA